MIDAKHGLFDLDGHYKPDLTLKKMILHWLRETIEDRKRKDSKAQNLKIKDLFIHKKIIIT